MGTDQVRLWRGGALCALLLALCCAAAPAAQGQDLERYAEGTWASMAAMTDEESGLPTDLMAADGTRQVQTSITNIGAYMWSVVGAEQAGIIGHDEAVERLEQTISTLEGMERHSERPVLQLVRPPDGREAHRLAADRRARGAAALVGRQRLARGRAEGRRHERPGARRAGARDLRLDGLGLLLRPGPQPDPLPLSSRARAPAPCCYDTIVSESRIARYIGIAQGRAPAQQYSGAYRAFPDTCDWSWTETRPGRLHAHLLRRARSTTAPTRTTARASRRAGAAACSRR